jgi:hypothetical protein
MNERWPDRKAGQKVEASAGKLFSVLIFASFYQEKEVALRGNERVDYYIRLLSTRDANVYREIASYLAMTCEEEINKHFHPNA